MKVIDDAPAASSQAAVRRWTAADLVLDFQAVSADLSCSDVLERFEAPDAPPALAVESPEGIGLIDRVTLATTLARPFGRALFERRPVASLMDPRPLCIDEQTPLVEIGEAIADRKPSALQTCFIITAGGAYRGIGVGLDLVRLHVEHAQWSLVQVGLMQESLIRSEKLASLGALVGGVAHEINTPIGITLTAATQFAETIAQLRDRAAAGQMRRRDFDDSIAVAAETARLIVANAGRAAELVQSFKRIAVDQTSGDCRTFALGAYLRDVVRSLQPQLRHTGHTVTVLCDDALVVRTYPGALSQVLGNLINNSIVHAFDPGMAGSIAISARLAADQVELCFEDDGRGIARELHGRIFEPFFTTRRASGGSGLGLNIVHNIVTRTLRGRIAVESSPGEGTRFLMQFPREIPDAGGDGVSESERRRARFGGTE